MALNTVIATLNQSSRVTLSFRTSKQIKSWEVMSHLRMNWNLNLSLISSRHLFLTY